MIYVRFELLSYLSYVSDLEAAARAARGQAVSTRSWPSLNIFPHAPTPGPSAMGPSSRGKKAGSLAEKQQTTWFMRADGTRGARPGCVDAIMALDEESRQARLKIHQRGVQWKKGVVICMLLYTTLSYNTTPIRCTPLPLHPPVMNTQRRRLRRRKTPRTQRHGNLLVTIGRSPLL